MGSDNLHGKRKIRRQKELQRCRTNRQPYDKVLIVCEGEKTERHYFGSVRKHYRLKAVSVFYKCGNDPLSIAKAAEKKMKIAKREGDPYDKVYCVFDKDDHSAYDKAVGLLERNPKIEAIVTVPCFEFWFLLHFKDTAQPFRDCNQVIQLLKKHIPDYRKGKKDLFDDDLLTGLEKAKRRAKKICAAQQRSSTDNPSTQVHELIEYLQNEARKNR